MRRVGEPGRIEDPQSRLCGSEPRVGFLVLRAAVCRQTEEAREGSERRPLYDEGGEDYGEADEEDLRPRGEGPPEATVRACQRDSRIAAADPRPRHEEHGLPGGQRPAIAPDEPIEAAAEVRAGITQATRTRSRMRRRRRFRQQRPGRSRRQRPRDVRQFEPDEDEHQALEQEGDATTGRVLDAVSGLPASWTYRATTIPAAQTETTPTLRRARRAARRHTA